MNALRSALTLLSVACTAGGQSGPAPTLHIIPPSEVVLLEGQSAEIGFPGAPTAVFVKFSRVVTDSRCPQNVQCVWAGEVVVLLTYSGEASGELALGLPGSETRPNAGDAGRYRLELLDVTPYPVADRPRGESSRVKLAVTVRP